MKSLIRHFPLLLAALLLTACASIAIQPPIANPPVSKPMMPLVGKDHPIVAFVLGSGAARGFAHVGVLKTLEENGIEADLVVGASAGSVVGVLYAGGVRGEALVEAAMQLERNQLTDWIFPNRGVMRGYLIQLYVNKMLHEMPLEALPTPFVAVATNLESGELITFNSGNAGAAVRASSAIPGLIQPVEINGAEYVDGGLVSQVPVRVARQLGADIIIAVDVSKHPLQRERLTTTMAVMQQALIIMSNRVTDLELREADVVIRPKVGEITISDFETRAQALAAGESAALEALAEIKRLIATKVSAAHP